MNAPFVLNLPSLAAQMASTPANAPSGGNTSAQPQTESGRDARVTLAVPYLKSFLNHAGAATQAALTAAAGLAALIARLVRAIVERIASVFGFRSSAGEAPVSTAATTASASDGVTPVADAGKSLDLTGPADKAAEAGGAIDSAIEGVAKYVAELLARTPKTADLEGDGGALFLTQALSQLGAGLKEFQEAHGKQSLELQSMASSYAAQINASAPAGTPPLGAPQVIDFLNKPELARANENAALVALRERHAAVRATEANLQKVRGHFVLHCQTAKSLGDDSPAYYVARRFVDQFADDQMRAEIELPLTQVNNFAETPVNEADLSENTLQNTPVVVDSQTELKVDKIINTAKSSRSERFAAKQDELAEISSAGIERQR